MTLTNKVQQMWDNLNKTNNEYALMNFTQGEFLTRALESYDWDNYKAVDYKKLTGAKSTIVQYKAVDSYLKRIRVTGK